MDYAEYYSNILKLNTFTNNKTLIDFNRKQYINNNTNVVAENQIISKLNKNVGKNIYTKISIEDIQNIIYTRIIVSSIGSFLCIICIIIYIIVFVKKRCLRNRSYSDDRANSPERLNTIDYKLGEKFLTEKSNCANSEEESGENKIRISDVDNNTKNYFRSSTSNYYENSFSKASNPNKIYNFNWNCNSGKLKDSFILKDEISKIHDISSIDFNRKTVVNKIRYLASNTDEHNKEQAYCRVSEPVYIGKESENFNYARLSKIEELNHVNNKYNIESSNINFLITEVSKNNYNHSKNNLINNHHHGSSKYLFVNKLKLYKNEELIDPKKDILENIYDKNIMHEDLTKGNTKNRTFSNNIKKYDQKEQEIESSKELMTENKHSSRINNKEENSNFLNKSYSNRSNSLFNKSNFDSSNNNYKNKNRQIMTKVNSSNNLPNCKRVNKKINAKKSNSDFYCIFDYKENAISTNSNKSSKQNYNYTSSKNNDTILAQSDPGEYREHLHDGTLKNYDDEFSSASENSIMNECVLQNQTPKELKMGMINDILFMLIFSNLGFLSSSFIVYSTNNLDKSSNMCKTQGIIQNYFDLASICWTTVVSNVMKNMIISINIDSEKRKFKWYLSYCLILPLMFCLG